ncbi:putative polyphosphate/ATP-dependent NAD kinase [Anaerospora hongkongensis]|uniref:Putative polyphosphate/ATP-dependent NAD kinase n=1 Tax=Anaerospora hongkongensis TaxID=244830 RepID=A0A4R1PWT1_9FIRM|nr:NAD(+)/NADH kinase [Anaerospora hongkongensis]TCL36927.1 putative polyphosphate/ATP-dependent NAD kinase [Anaerospora hongkongensis]
MATVGIIANPASGKDIRRLVAYGTVFDNQEKVNIVRRLLLGLAAAGVDRVLFMPDYYGIVPKAIQGISCCQSLKLKIMPVDMEITGTQRDSLLAARLMRQAGADCLVTLGGDGTNRMVAKGCEDIPLVPVSTGTNNVFPVMVEGTIAGLAAGIIAKRGPDNKAGVNQTKLLVVYKNGCPVDSALIDAVVLDQSFTGARAIWHPERMLQAVLTRGEPDNLGISAIGGAAHPVAAYEPCGLSLCFGTGGTSVVAPIAPGLILPIPIKQFEVIQVGAYVKIAAGPCLLALDGEREMEVTEKDEVAIQLTFAGPFVADSKAILTDAVKNNFFTSLGELNVKGV